jgi:hypothetical protein
VPYFDETVQHDATTGKMEWFVSLTLTFPRRSGPPDMRVLEGLRRLREWDVSITS